MNTSVKISSVLLLRCIVYPLFDFQFLFVVVLKCCFKEKLSPTSLRKFQRNAGFQPNVKRSGTLGVKGTFQVLFLIRII
ncbi:hypothetical protein Barb4_05447 [Bacteroidales bacterium Barb4]|nr:hypothetical protein Barb4_05447 [Bacteroidales bacterium Barb4]